MMIGTIGSPVFTAAISIAIVWELVWKGIGLWKSARNDQRY